MKELMGRQLEMLNVFMGVCRAHLVWFRSVLTGQYEQANRYAIQTPEGHLVGLYVPLPCPTCSSVWEVKEKNK